MPNEKTHEFATKVVFGAPFTKIHQLLDYPSKLYGKGHRRFYHDEEHCRYLQRLNKDRRVYPACKFHIFLDQHRDAIKLETLVELQQFEAAERLVRRTYSEWKQSHLDPDNIQAQLEKDRKLIEEIRRLQRGTAESSQSEITWEDVIEMREIERMFGTTKVNRQQQVDIKAALEAYGEQLVARTEAFLDKQDSRGSVSLPPDETKRNFRKAETKTFAEEISVALAPLLKQLEALNRQMDDLADKL